MFFITVNIPKAMSTVHVIFILEKISKGSFLLNTLSKNSTYTRAISTMPMMTKGFCLSDNSISPCNSAVTARVVPHPGQLK